MARLSVKHQGEEIAQLTLEAGREYVAGRSNDSQIVLPSHKGISRHHLKFYERDGAWVCEALSKFVLIQKGGQSQEVLELNEDCVFGVGPFELHFTPTATESEVPAESVSSPSTPVEPVSKNLPAFYNPSQVPEDTAPRANNEATMAGVSNVVPYFRISYPNTADDEVLKLEGQLWTAGRDPSCEIFVDSPHISRKHFEMAHTNEGFFITDLGSSNGTKINGNKIPPHEPTRIESGDTLSVMSVDMLFEIRDMQFQQRLEAMPIPEFDPMIPAQSNAPALVEGGNDLMLMPQDMQMMQMQMQMMQMQQQQQYYPEPEAEAKGAAKYIALAKKHKIRVAIVAVLLIGVYLGTAEDKKPVVPRGPAKDSENSVSFEKLTPEQKSTVRDAFGLARTLYVQGKYELCLTELAKVHQLLPKYENSPELNSFCEQGRELVKRQVELARREKERAIVEQQIKGQVETCAATLPKDATVDQTRMCLAEVIELSPDHALIADMIHAAQLREDQAKTDAANRDALNAKIAKGQSHFERIRAIYKKGLLAKAITEYEKFLNVPYPQDDKNKDAARRDLASMRKELKSKISTLLDQCNQLAAKNKFREAYQACDSAVQVDPGNKTAAETRGHMLSELKRDLKTIYEDSVLEESMGNVDVAKEKWKKIIKEGIGPADDYTDKSKSKLLKYGIEM